MRLDQEAESDNIQDDRGNTYSAGMGGGGGGLGGLLIPLLINTIGFRGIIILAVIYFALKMFTGFDLINAVNGGGGGIDTQYTTAQTRPTSAAPGRSAAGQSATSDPGRKFVAQVLNSTDEVWTQEFAAMGRKYEKPTLVLYSNQDRSGCGAAQSAMGPFYCPADHKIYLDLAFYQEMKDRFGAPGEFAQAYVIAHEVGHHVQNQLGTAGQVEQARMRMSQVDANRLSVKTELQADCYAGIWAQETSAMSHIQLENGDIEQALNAASQIGDDHLQRVSRGVVQPDTFTHGTSAQRVKWFKQGLNASSINDCDTFNTSNLG